MMKTKILLTSLFLSTALCTLAPSIKAMEKKEEQEFFPKSILSNKKIDEEKENDFLQGDDNERSSSNILLNASNPSLALIHSPPLLKRKLSRLILSIDGGGIRGIIPAEMLKYLENAIFAEVKRHLPKEAPHIPLESFGDLFSLTAGTSTGGIITLGMRGRSEGVKPGMQGLVKLYETQGQAIFTPQARGFVKKVISPLVSNKYEAAPLEEILEGYFGNLTLKDLHNPTLITTYDLPNEILYVFNSMNAKINPSDNYEVKGVARATSAAPTYFPAVKIKNEAGEEKTLVDGGVTANNPTLLAYLEAQKLYPHDRLYIVSLGCGVVPLFTSQNREKGGLLQWGQDIFSVVSNSSSRMIENLMSNSVHLRKDDYVRIQFDLAEEVKDMDSADKQNILHLKGYANRAIDDENHKIHKIKNFILEQIEANQWSVYLNLASQIDQQIEEGQEILDLTNCRLTDRAFWEVKKKLLETDHKFRGICLQGNTLTPYMAACLGELPMMAMIDLRNTNMTQEILKEVKSSFLSLKNLKTIDLRNNSGLKTIEPAFLLNLITKENKYDAYTLSFDEEVLHKLGAYMQNVQDFEGAVYFYGKGKTSLTQIALAELYLMSRQDDENSQKEAFKKGVDLCKNLANQGIKKAQFLMGSFFEKALAQATIKQYLIEENLISAQENLNQKAAHYYKLAADHQHKRAAFLLAEMYFSNKVNAPLYEEGRSQKDFHQLQEALKYYQIAAQAGSQTAQKKISTVEREIQRLKQ